MSCLVGPAVAALGVEAEDGLPPSPSGPSVTLCGVTATIPHGVGPVSWKLGWIASRCTERRTQGRSSPGNGPTGPSADWPGLAPGRENAPKGRAGRLTDPAGPCKERIPHADPYKPDAAAWDPADAAGPPPD